MNTVGTVLVRIVALTSGALIGVLLANWYDKTQTDHEQEKVDYDKIRYAQGLTPLSLQQIIMEKGSGE
jgi:hypothetical protein